MKKWRFCLFVLLIVLLVVVLPCASAEPLPSDGGGDWSLESRFYSLDKQIDERTTGPGLPPPRWKTNAPLATRLSISASTMNIADVPALAWSYGCSATAAAMYFGYYDRHGYPDMYTGPTDGGVFPITNEVWGFSSEGYGECPLSASHIGIDGRTIKGHADDYYYSYSSAVDPYYGAWPEHSPHVSVGDFMGTSQYRNWQNVDGSTRFFFYEDGSPLYDYTGYESVKIRDGTHGIKLFAESRGYTVTSNFNQYIYGFDGNTQGFTYEQYMAEIDAGNPVLIQVDGHTMLGVGYSGTNEIIVHDTWDYSEHAMTWGGSYATMVHYGVTVIHLASPVPVATFVTNVSSGDAPLAVKFTDQSTGSPTRWNWSFGDGTVFNTMDSALKSPTHVFSSAGTYSVNLVACNSGGCNTTAPGTIITVTPIIVTLPPVANGPVAKFSKNVSTGLAPLSVKFGDQSTGTGIKRWNWSFGDGTWFNTTIASQRSPRHIYTLAGVFNIRLTVCNETGCNTTIPGQNISVTTVNAPFAKFAKNVSTGFAPLSVKYTDQSTGTIINRWNWSFGDGTWFNTTVAAQKSPTHVYGAAGVYTVRLTVCNAAGCNTMIPGQTVTVTSVALPFVKFSRNVTSGRAPLSVAFGDQSTGSGINRWNWSFGDGTWFNTSVASLKNPKHVFTAKGVYNVRLTVCNSAGCNTTIPGQNITAR